MRQNIRIQIRQLRDTLAWVASEHQANCSDFEFKLIKEAKQNGTEIPQASKDELAADREALEQLRSIQDMIKGILKEDE